MACFCLSKIGRELHHVRFSTCLFWVECRRQFWAGTATLKMLLPHTYIPAYGNGPSQLICPIHKKWDKTRKSELFAWLLQTGKKKNKTKKNHQQVEPDILLVQLFLLSLALKLVSVFYMQQYIMKSHPGFHVGLSLVIRNAAEHILLKVPSPDLVFSPVK